MADAADSDPEPAGASDPANQYLAPERVIESMARFGARRLTELSASQILVLAALAGAFITGGALFSVLLAIGTENPGVARLLEGFGFSAGFFFVILTHAALFTDLDGDGRDELYVASDRHKQVRRYVWNGRDFDRETIYTRPDDRPVFTWNLMPVPGELSP